MDDKEHIRLLKWQVQQQARVIKKQRETIEHCRLDYNRGSKWHNKAIQVISDLYRTRKELEAVKAELAKYKEG